MYVFRTDSETTTFLKQNITRLLIQRIYTHTNMSHCLVSWALVSKYYRYFLHFPLFSAFSFSVLNSLIPVTDCPISCHFILFLPLTLLFCVISVSIMSTFIISDNFISPAIPVGRGVLQEDCLSPLLFNMCFNTFIQSVKQGKYKQLGFSAHDATDRLFKPIHWFQYADDAAVITTDERENQLFLNCFIKWCQWADMIIRVDKCVSFGIKKFSSRCLQFQPKLFINIKLLPVVKNGESFKYLGRYFNFEINNDKHKIHLESNRMLKQIDSLRILPKNKLLFYHRYVLSKLSWHLTVADLSKPLIIENLDNVVIRFIRQCLDLPISATLSGINLLETNLA